jgi:Flp pilus assembly protein TadG
MVEFAFVVPVLMMVLVGIFAVGTVMQDYQQLTNVENQGLVTLEQLPDTANAADPCAAVSAAIIGAAGNLRTTGTNGLQVSITFGTGTSSASYPSSGTTSPTGYSCGGGSSYVVQGEPVTLTVTYPSTFLGFTLTPNGLLSLTEWEQI